MRRHSYVERKIAGFFAQLQVEDARHDGGALRRVRWPQACELGMLMVLSLEWLIFFREELRGYLVGGFGGAWAPLDTAPGHVSIGQAEGS